LRDSGFTDVTTLECLQRVLDVRSVSVPVANLGYGPVNVTDDLELDNTVSGHVKTMKSVHHQKAKNIKHSSDASANNTDDNVTDAETVPEVSNEPHTSTENWDSHKQPHKKFTHSFKCAVPVSQMTGHTGYLTFATLYPK